ncbi:MAG: peptidase rane alanine aminopeptidase [Nocardioides sp.]|nr:peptidase rane alanine aminopeptidase [Nocardioides sp.]
MSLALLGALTLGALGGSAAVVGPATAVGLASGILTEPEGGPGAGDAYFPLDGNEGIDVLRYDIHDTYTFHDRRLTGWTELRLRATRDLSSFDLDLLLPVQVVKVDGVTVDHTKPSRHELRVEAPIVTGTTYHVLVRYGGHPGGISYAGERNWLASDREVVAMNEPHMAPWWFPANDHPSDKAVMDINITAPLDKVVVANGRLLGRKVHGNRATTRWHAPEPMASYLAFFAAGHFEVAHGTRDGLPWYVAVSKRIPQQERRASMRLMKQTSVLTAWLQSQLGDYPFSETGGLTTSLNPGFALENQTRPTYPELSSDGLTTVVHELAHQWFGDSVAIAQWRDIWLNEGFATFMEVRYAETHGGQSGQNWLRNWYDYYASNAGFWQLRVDDPGAGHIFDYPIYQRGAMTLQALRHRIGSADFWHLLRKWARTRAGGNGSSAEFEALAAQVSGEDLGTFFDAWLRGDSPPAPTAANGLR